MAVTVKTLEDLAGFKIKTVQFIYSIKELFDETVNPISFEKLRYGGPAFATTYTNGFITLNRGGGCAGSDFIEMIVLDKKFNIIGEWEVIR